ncbi:hypothetical protein CDAR_168921 [Caerostris darwini]|uniref:Uncharacterized protein n=1 Tax=Caerostris darwini TaxID=1538125 RepID=A0AAV4WSM9_9ARAC|nr:hypothetical protein CDAR_168921 [Caerostris darwini]
MYVSLFIPLDYNSVFCYKFLRRLYLLAQPASLGNILQILGSRGGTAIFSLHIGGYRGRSLSGCFRVGLSQPSTRYFWEDALFFFFSCSHPPSFFVAFKNQFKSKEREREKIKKGREKGKDCSHAAKISPAPRNSFLILPTSVKLSSTHLPLCQLRFLFCWLAFFLHAHYRSPAKDAFLTPLAHPEPPLPIPFSHPLQALFCFSGDAFLILNSKTLTPPSPTPSPFHLARAPLPTPFHASSKSGTWKCGNGSNRA